MKIHMDIANGYRDTKIAKLKLDNPNWTPKQATTRFIEDVYSEWIKANLGNDFVICDDVNEKNFRIDFTYEDDANAFRRQIGGRVVED